MAEAESTRDLIRKRGAIKRRLTNLETYINSKQDLEPNNSLCFELEQRLDKNRSLLDEYNDVFQKLIIVCEEDELDEIYQDQEIFENKYFSQVTRLQLKISQLKQILTKPNSPSSIRSERINAYVNSERSVSEFISIKSKNDDIQQTIAHLENTPIKVPEFSQPMLQPNIQSNIRLPTITIPKFKGEYSNWLEFKDTFISLVHRNSSIDNIQKFHYLRAALEGDAMKLIHSLEFSASNYEVAWELLYNRYNNDRLLIHNHLKSVFSLQNLLKESPSGIRYLIDTTLKHLRALESLNQPTQHWDTLIIYIISSKLDKITAREWEQQRVSHEVPTLEEFRQFLNAKADLLDTLQVSQKDTITKVHCNAAMSINYKCYYCKGAHPIYKCNEFLKLDVATRISKVKLLKLCNNCLKFGHNTNICNAKPCCIKCSLKHNTLIHQDNHNLSTSVLTSSTKTKFNNVLGLLGTVKVKVRDSEGKFHFVKALLDTGSQSNFITTPLVKKLNLRSSDCRTTIINGINNSTSQVTKKCSVIIHSNYNDYQFNLPCLVLNNITDKLPCENIDISDWKLPGHIRLADPEFFISQHVDILIGCTYFWNLLIEGKIELGKNMPILKNTILGWVVAGNINCKNANTYCNFVTTNTNDQDSLLRFWEIEEPPMFETKHMSNDDRECELKFVNSFQRNEDGRFVVDIPFKVSTENLGDSKRVALKCFQSLESKFKRNNDLKQAYTAFMQEYIDMGHMSKVTETNSPKQSYFFPHHGVFNTNSITTKLRVVFNGSAKTDSGYSLNDLQHVGAIIQDDIFSILLRFRTYQIVVGADVAKMYRQILINPQQRSFQQIFWRSDPSKEIDIYQLNTVTYGTTSAPFLAIRCLKQLALESAETYPNASRVILHDFYVDDLLTGTDTVEEAIQLSNEVSTILRSACLELRKWISNSSKVLENIQFPENSESDTFLFGKTENTKTLGLQWSCKEDILHFKISDKSIKTITKRNVLSDISQIYDPLGLLSPCIILAKILIQKLWLQKLSWDEILPSHIAKQWIQFRKQLILINDITVPRNVLCHNHIRLELHGFADASMDAYGACVYVKSVDKYNNTNVSLLCSKSKVSPLKTLTIPRLELCAALGLAKIITRIKKSINKNFESTFLWSDSVVALSWIKTPPHLLQVFVSNRVSQIQNLTSPNRWFHTKTQDNPADLLTRGIFPSKLLNLQLWWHGPKWLSSQFQNIETEFNSLQLEELPEVRKKVIAMHVVTSRQTIFPFHRYSDIIFLKRVAAYCVRFYTNARSSKQERKCGPLNVKEIDKGLSKLIYVSQQETFFEEIINLRLNSQICSKSRIISLAPFIDTEGILRVGGRLKLSNFSYEKKHQILMCSKHPLTKLLFEFEHIQLLHAGPQLLLSSIRQKYWPIAAKNLAKITVRHCIKCFRFNAQTMNPQMGELPIHRVTPQFPFTVTGIDYGGPFLIKDRKGRGSKTSKSYLCLFVCFATKALHLELVTDMTTETFIAALKSFVSRRGKPTHLYSDNGTNFHGAHNELSDVISFLSKNQRELQSYFTNEQITWHFIPPQSPNFGGLWEASIKSVKYHIKRVIGEAILTFEEFYTILTQIESILNSRLLYSMSTDPNDFEPLTPSHFLIGRHFMAIPETDLQEEKINRLSRFQLLQQMQQHFWKRWSKEYISELQVRSKWKHSTENLKLGAMVLVKEDNLPPTKWLLGRVQDLHRGKDGECRVVTVKTAKGIFKRPVRKLCPLPICDGD